MAYLPERYPLIVGEAEIFSLDAPLAPLVPPTITTTGSHLVAENTQLSIALTANEAVTWSISGGVDSGAFEISGTTLRWLNNGAKNYEDPSHDPLYLVEITATDADDLTDTLLISVTVTDETESGGQYLQYAAILEDA